MARVRIHLLAREMGISNNELITLLTGLGISVKSHSSTIEEATARAVKQMRADAEAKKVAEAEAALAPPKPVAPPLPTPPPTPVAPSPPPTIESPSPPSAGVASYAPTGPKKPIKIPPVVTIRELAERISVPVNELIKRLMKMNILRSANQSLPSDIASRIAEEFGYAATVERVRPQERLKPDEKDRLTTAAPVVTIMGHVDHGKTTLLDFIRKTDVAGSEAGRITQRIGAYEVHHGEKRLVFLDTPGHEAFTAMRARGAHVTDLAVLVVAADDGVMPQTEEAIDHARAAGVPLLVAINKMDKPGANPDRVKQQLAELDVVPHDWGGDIECIPVSAKTGQGIEELLETILVMAEFEDLKTNTHGGARGTVIEAQMEPQRGPIATVLIRTGRLHLGDYIVAGNVWGRVRKMHNYRGETVEVAKAVMPVSIIGFQSVPHASDQLQVMGDARMARDRAAHFGDEMKSSRMMGHEHMTLEHLFQQVKQGQVKDLKLIVKADQQGTVEAVAASLQRLTTDEVRARIIHRGVGNVLESDVMLATASNAVIIAFSVGVESGATSLADREKIEIRTYDVIYHALEDIEAAMLGMLEPVFEERLSGEAEVMALFKSTRAGIIAGCRIRNGKVVRGSKALVLRGNAQVFEGRLDSLRHVKDDVAELAVPQECGISFRNFKDVRVGDTIQSHVTVEVARTAKRS